MNSAPHILPVHIGEASVTNNTAPRDRIDRNVAGHSQNALSVAHHDVLALTHNAKACLLRHTLCLKVALR